MKGETHSDPLSRRVVLLHGIWMVGATMQWVGARLRAAGFAAEIFGYHSIVGGPDEAVPRLAEQLRGGGETDIVAHSLGGLVALQAPAAERSEEHTSDLQSLMRITYAV